MNRMSKYFMLMSSAALLAACGNGESDSSGENSGNGGSASSDEVTVWVQYSEESAEGQVMVESIEEFNETNEEGITAVVEYIPRSGSGGGYEDKINAALTTDSLPDVITLDGPNTAAYANSQIIQPLDEYISSTDDLLPSIIEQGTFNDELYSIGYSESGVGFFYNRTMLEEAGVDLDTLPTVDDPWTWDEFNGLLDTLASNYDGPVLDMGFDDQSEWLLYAFSPFVWSAGGEITNEEGTEAVGYFDSEETVSAFDFIQSLVEEGYSTITPVEKGFHTGEYPLYMSGSWTMQELDNEYEDIDYGIMPYPVSPNTNELFSPTGSWAYGMTTSTEKPEEAGVLIEFLTSEQELYDMSMGNSVLPARQSVADRMLEEVEEPMQVLIEQNSKTGRARPTLINYPQVSRTFQETVTESTYYEQNPDLNSLLETKAQEIESNLE
ncbi:fructooligosaccharide transport system substrate-binding protein [Alkalibacterium putridalgicola]|uniref:Fructooligosaccharide transport system substrate-binding protein n=1 Tax=Alkalibacterium putridalgicola TaxID=426703 RepID=A0A1H7VRN7_9LACT|nr:sugar ABC transporter substrate-binding protein [Alkalibacterium putridalgicola]GEK89862.1 sugar ABC transporter substrate-binding protein [Alkalibacterium putridalgicola]SEM11549.1 fructooligosaccharide transport system substrate-binding protein [Alkalibacterium putridalgicola]